MDTSCLFCNIIQRKIPATIVFETDAVLAFRDIHPTAPIHILVVPKIHIQTVMDITNNDQKLLSALFDAMQKIAQQEKIADTGFRIVINNGPNAGQAVEHLHFHLIGGRQMTWPAG